MPIFKIIFNNTNGKWKRIWLSIRWYWCEINIEKKRFIRRWYWSNDRLIIGFLRRQYKEKKWAPF